MYSTLSANQPVNTPYDYRREAKASYARGVGALAFSGLAVGAALKYGHRAMPQAFTEALFSDPRMLGWGIREATTTGLKSSLIYARKFGLGEFASGVPKFRYVDLAMNLAKMVEEVSPSQIARTFGLYEHLVPFATRKGVTFRFTGQEALQQRQYLSSLVGRHIGERELLGGVTLERGKLFLERGAEGRREQILERAHLMMRKYVPRGAAGEEFWHFGKIAPAYEEVVAGGRVLPSARAGLAGGGIEAGPSFMIGGGRTRLQAAWRYWQATTRTWTQRFFKLMDDPFLSMLEVTGHYDQEMVRGARSGFMGTALGGASRAWRAAKFEGRFGLGGIYTGSTTQMFGRWLRPEMMRTGPMVRAVGGKFFRPGAALALIGIPFAYHTVDQLLAKFGGGGIPGLAAGVYQGGMMMRAETLGKVFGPLARAQERVAPGSTEWYGPLPAIGALPLAGGLTGAFAGYVHRVAGSIAGDPTKALEVARTPRRLRGALGKLFRSPLGRTGRWGAIGMAIGGALALPMVAGAAARLLGGVETPEELRELYAGRREVPVMASRWWSFGRTLITGKKPAYYTPHWTVRAQTRYQDAALFAGGESWLFKAIKKTPLLQDIVDPYYFEKLHYYDRPYPVAGPSDLGMGIIDPLYKATIGRIFKPVRYMHEGEWRTEEGEAAAWEPRPKLAPEPELGGEAPYRPRDPYAMDQLAKQTLDYYSDAIGIVGWIGRLATRAAVGQLTPYDVRPELESSARMSSVKRAYWDASLGDPGGITEAYRRLNPRRDRGQYYSPIANRMPAWLPGEQYFLNFRTGDPYGKIPRGEMRLPGPGYVAMHPELEGVAPEDYPEFHRFSILADVAPYSTEYKEHNRRMTIMTRQGALSQEEQTQVKVIRKQVNSVKQRKQFAEYMTEQELAEQNIGAVGRAMADYWDVVSRLETPVEQVMFPPIAPMGKLIHRRTALEDYEQAQIYGTDLSFWNRVYDNFIRPGIWRFANVMGYEGVPPHIRRRRDIEEYFDKLDYIKNVRLHRAAIDLGDAESAQLYRTKTKETMTGMNPYGNPLWILRAMPKRERDYWEAFREERDPEKQVRIMELVPDGVKEIYRAAYLQRAAKDIRRISKKGILAEKDQAKAEGMLEYISKDMERQGQPHGAKLGVEFQRALSKGQAKPHQYADWYRKKEVQAYFESHRLPDEGWIGWDPRVDLEDVKMNYVRQEGYDFHDYDLWEDRLYSMTRKPYLAEAANQLDIDFADSPEHTQEKIRHLLDGYDPDLFTIIPTLNGGKIEMTINDTQGDRFQRAIGLARLG